MNLTNDNATVGLSSKTERLQSLLGEEQTAAVKPASTAVLLEKPTDQLMHHLSVQSQAMAKLIDNAEAEAKLAERQEQRQLFGEVHDQLKRVLREVEATKHVVVTMEQERNERLMMQSEAHSNAEEWQPIQINYVAGFLERCISRMNMHEEAVRYYTRLHYYITIPATTLGVISSTAAFTQWSDDVLCGEVSWVWVVVGLLMALTTLLHNLSENVFGFKDKARHHHASFIDYGRLVKRVGNELNNPATEHRAYRQFMESISEDYDRYTEKAPVIPKKVDKDLRQRWLQNAEREAQESGDEDNRRGSHSGEAKMIQNSGVSTAIDAAPAAKDCNNSGNSDGMKQSEEVYVDTNERIRKSIAAFQAQKNHFYPARDRTAHFHSNRDLIDYCTNNNQLRRRTSKMAGTNSSRNVSAEKNAKRRQSAPPFQTFEHAHGLTERPRNDFCEREIINPDNNFASVGSSARSIGAGGRPVGVQHNNKKKRPRRKKKKSRRDESRSFANAPLGSLPVSIDKIEDDFAETPEDIQSVVSGQVQFSTDKV